MLRGLLVEGSSRLKLEEIITLRININIKKSFNIIYNFVQSNFAVLLDKN